MSSQKLEDLVISNLNQFPVKTRRVIEYILSNSSEIAFQSVSEVAEKLSVSRAQLVRVSRILGFEGYADLKNSLKEKVMQKVIPASSKTELDSSSEIISKLCELEQANINFTYKNLISNDGTIKNFCEAVRNSDVVYCMGWGISSMPAEWFYTRFSELGLKSVLMRRGSLSLIEQARAVSQNDMLIVCELPSYVIEVHEAVKLIASRNTRIATLTDSQAAPVCAYAQMKFFVSDQSPMFGSSLIGSMFAVHALTSVLAQNMGSIGRSALEVQAEALRDQRVYYPSYELRY